MKKYYKESKDYCYTIDICSDDKKFMQHLDECFDVTDSLESAIEMITGKEVVSFDEQRTSSTGPLVGGEHYGYKYMLQSEFGFKKYPRPGVLIDNLPGKAPKDIYINCWINSPVFMEILLDDDTCCPVYDGPCFMDSQDAIDAYIEVFQEMGYTIPACKVDDPDFDMNNVFFKNVVEIVGKDHKISIEYKDYSDYHIEYGTKREPIGKYKKSENKKIEDKMDQFFNKVNEESFIQKLLDQCSKKGYKIPMTSTVVTMEMGRRAFKEGYKAAKEID